MNTQHCRKGRKAFFFTDQHTRDRSGGGSFLGYQNQTKKVRNGKMGKSILKFSPPMDADERRIKADEIKF
jgi:hypothetical protein